MFANLPTDIQKQILAFSSKGNWLSILLCCKSWRNFGKELFDPSTENNKFVFVRKKI